MFISNACLPLKYLSSQFVLSRAYVCLCRASVVPKPHRRFKKSTDVAEAKKQVSEEELREQIEDFEATYGGTIDLFRRITSVSVPCYASYLRSARLFVGSWSGCLAA